MIVHIHDNLRVLDLQERFSKCFECLKIEFYKQPHPDKNKLISDYLIHPEKSVGEIRQNKNEGDMEIKSWYTVGKVEKAFKENYGLNVRIFRKKNRGWIQLVDTDQFKSFDRSYECDQ